jgi:acetyl/propionyl-CoA carboxylase alpha subunit
VQTQIAAGRRPDAGALGLDPAHRPPHGVPIQWRINAETLDDGRATPAVAARLTRFDLAQRPGRARRHLRLAGLAPSRHHDSLLAKLMVHHARPAAAEAAAPLARALAEVPHRRRGRPTWRCCARWPRPTTWPTGACHTRWLEAPAPNCKERNAAHDALRRSAGAAQACHPDRAAAVTPAAEVGEAPMSGRMVLHQRRPWRDGGGRQRGRWCWRR